MIQQVPGGAWMVRKDAPRDLAALSPLITQHSNPNGRFELDMDARIPIAA